MKRLLTGLPAISGAALAAKRRSPTAGRPRSMPTTA